MYGSIKYGREKYGKKLLTKKEVELYRPDLLTYLPQFLRDTKEFKVLDKVLGDELALLSLQIEDLVKQCFIDTATWGLTLWEKEYAVKTDINKSYEERREVLKAKKRGHGTVTRNLIKETAEAFSGGQVEVIEEFKSYCFIVKFIGVKGIPKNLAAFKDMIDTIKPAHLAYDFKYTYTIWDFLTEKGVKWDNNSSWNDFKIYE
ncbi:YmfQ family protein [Clostridium rectalis]|uniref:YmfQ family protein n=1 Tax=Clostridium rectalis TaxID=2040295 RepID=UPI000F6371F7|nr:YmfQ family protein [Clostridium rectalis]